MRFLLRDVEKFVCVALFLAMTGIGFINVAVRYLTDYSFAATEELLVNGFLLLTIFGAALAARRGDHLAVTLVYDLLPGPARKGLLLFSSALAVLLLALSVWFSWELVSNQLSTGTRSYGLRIPVWYYTIAMPFGFALVLIRYVQHACDSWRELDTDEAHRA